MGHPLVVFGFPKFEDNSMHPGERAPKRGLGHPGDFVSDEN